MEEERVVTLIEKKKKGLLRIIFSRTMVMVLAVALQVLFYLMIIMFFSEHAFPFTVAMTVLSLVLMIYLFNNRMDYTGKLTWIFFMGLFPIIGALFYLFTMTNMGHEKLKRGVQEQIDATKGILPQDPDTFQSLESSGTDDLCRYLNRSGCFPVYKNCEVT